MPRPSRRAFLGGVSTVALAGLGGCIGPGGSVAGPEGTPDSTRTPPPMTDPPEPTDPVLCRGDPIAVEWSTTDPPGYSEDDNIEYFPENETVRFVFARNATGPVSFRTLPLEKFGAFRAAAVAIDPLRRTVADRLGTDDFESGITTPIGQEGGFEHVIILRVVVRIKDGRVVRITTARLEQVLEAAPGGVDVTLRFEGDVYRRTVPVYAERRIRRGSVLQGEG